MTDKMADKPPRIEKVPDSERARYDELSAKFKERYGHEPSFYARAPGRVNLIGEHIDYSGYPVFPMAIEQDIVFAVSPVDDGKIVLANIKSDYSEFSCSVNDFTIDSSNPVWHNYALCGIKGTMEYVGAESVKGFEAMVDGRVPRSAGLSSSSALVVCAAMVMNHVNQWNLSLTQLAELTAKSERYIGTEGGGMDQAICLTANQGMAKLIKFNPLQTEDVQLPPGVGFLISNCLAEHNKAASSEFNTRVVECRIAAQVMGKKKGLDWRKVRTLGELHQKLGEGREGGGLSLEDMLETVVQTLERRPYTKEEVCDILQVSSQELATTSLSNNTLDVTSFQLFKRAMHVYAEAQRVQCFMDICQSRPQRAPYLLGLLLKESHHSLSNVYECSHPEVDRLVQLSWDSNVMGSRIVGAGWGGCVVSLVRADKIDTHLERLRDSFYRPDPAKAARMEEANFGTKPSKGACIYTN